MKSKTNNDLKSNSLMEAKVKVDNNNKNAFEYVNLSNDKEDKIVNDDSKYHKKIGSRVRVDNLININSRNPFEYFPIVTDKEEDVKNIGHNPLRAFDDSDLYFREKKEDKKQLLSSETRTKDDLDLELQERLNPSDVYVPELKKQSKFAYYLLYPFKKIFSFLSFLVNTKIGKFLTNPFLLSIIAAGLIIAAFLTPVGPFLMLGIAASVLTVNIITNIKPVIAGLTVIYQKLIAPLLETRLGKILTSKLAIAIYSVALIGATFLTPVGPIVATAAFFSLGAVAVGLIVNIYKTWRMENLKKEHNLCVKNKCLRNRQNEILKKYPDLDVILTKILHIQRNNNPQTKYIVGTLNKVSDTTIKTIFIQILNFAAKLHTFIAGAAAIAGTLSHGNIAPLINAIQQGATLSGSLVGTVHGEYSDSKISDSFKTSINRFNADYELKQYKNITELKSNVRAQNIQTLALEQLVNDENYSNMKPIEKQAKYLEIYKEIDERTKNITKKTLLLKLFKPIKIIPTALNPFYKAPTMEHIDKVNATTQLQKPLNIRNIRLSEDMSTKIENLPKGPLPKGNIQRGNVGKSMEI